MALKGAGNLSDMYIVPKADRMAMNIHLLKILGHKISFMDWSPFDKQVLWTACTTCFFTSSRMGELLCEQENSFDKSTTLLWGNVKFFEEGEISIFIPYTKTKGFKGQQVDLFSVRNSKICPVAALTRLKNLAEKGGLKRQTKPLFSFESGLLLTKKVMNKWLSNHLGDFASKNQKITGHSFRAAIPTAIANFPGKSSVSDILEWGHWESKSYKLYTKGDRDKKRVLFYRIIECLK